MKKHIIKATQIDQPKLKPAFYNGYIIERNVIKGDWHYSVEGRRFGTLQEAYDYLDTAHHLR